MRWSADGAWLGLCVALPLPRFPIEQHRILTTSGAVVVIPEARPGILRHPSRLVEPFPQARLSAYPEVSMRDFAIQLTHRPGELARIAAALSLHDVNIKSLACLAIGQQVLLRVIADDVEAARAALEGANIRFEESEVVQVLLENRAGELAAVSTKLAEAGVNLRGIYLTGIDGDLVELAIVPDDVKKAKRVLE